MLCAAAGCTRQDSQEPEPVEEAEGAFEDSLEYTDEQMAADDPRARIRGALATLGQADEIPENASLEELQAIVDEKVERGIIRKEHAKKLLKVLESADAHNRRLEQMDEQLFGENAH